MHTMSLPTDSPVPYFHQPERGHLPEGVPSDIDLPVGALHEDAKCTNTTQTCKV